MRDALLTLFGAYPEAQVRAGMLRLPLPRWPLPVLELVQALEPVCPFVFAVQALTEWPEKRAEVAARKALTSG